MRGGEAAQKPPNFLRDEIVARVGQAPVAFRQSYAVSFGRRQ